MQPGRTGTPPRSDRRDSDSEPLRLIAEGICEVAGFQVVGISLKRDDWFEVVAVAASTDMETGLIGLRTPVDPLLDLLEKAQSWGSWYFMPQEISDEIPEEWAWTPAFVPLDGDDAWNPEDTLVALLHDEDDQLIGLLSVDLPVSGRRPDGEQRLMLDKYSAQAGRAVTGVLEREHLAERVRLAVTTRQVVRAASGELRVETLLEQCRSTLSEGLQADLVWIRLFDEGGVNALVEQHAAASAAVDDPSLQILVEELARAAWDEHVASMGKPARANWDAASRLPLTALSQALSGPEGGPLLLVPLAAGAGCFGALVLGRSSEGAEWTEVERDAVLDVGLDLGRALSNARTFEREQRLVASLQELDEYKSQLISTIAHEVSNPMTAVLGHAELLAGRALDEESEASVSAIRRAGARISGLVEDLLLLSRFDALTSPMTVERVDLGKLISEVRALLQPQADLREVGIEVQPDQCASVVPGDPVELERMLVNLISNAIKYSGVGGNVGVSLTNHDSEIEIAVQDQGIGIAEADQQYLFTEFFRSPDSAVRSVPGTGLGLVIVDRIVARHGGRIEVQSRLGIGSTFRVWLPANDVSDPVVPPCAGQ